MLRRFTIAMLAAAAALPGMAGQVHYASDFAAGCGEWSGYNEKNPVALSVHEEDGTAFLRFAPGGGVWNQPILDLPRPVTVSARTMVQFRIRMPIPFNHEMHIEDATEDAAYKLGFLVNGQDWLTVRKYLLPAELHQARDGSRANDGLPGDEISRITLVLWGEPIDIADFEIFEADGTEVELPQDLDQPAIEAYMADYRYPDFAIFKRNGFFPYGPVSRIDANLFQQEHLGRPLEEGIRDDLADMRLNFMNTYLNFCDSTPYSLRLEALDASGMKLIETMFSNTRFDRLGADDPAWADLAAVAAHPGLLAWYGRDEPLPGSYAQYLSDKKAVESRDPAHPFTSAFNVPVTREKLGPGMEVIMPDIYSIRSETADRRQAILEHFDLVREAQSQSPGGNVWFMTQSFSNRVSDGSYVWLYPTPGEMRLDLNVLAAAGADGILFFIYNDRTPYLSGTAGEKFDSTLVDSWGNGDAVYAEIARFGETMVPVLPSLLDAVPVEEPAVEVPAPLLLGRSRNELGVYCYFVNTSLDEPFTGRVAIPVPSGMGLYCLETARPSDGTLALEPGEGTLLFLGSQENFERIAAEIAARREAEAADRERLRRQLRLDAGFADGNASSEWEEAGEALLAVQRQFGAIDDCLTLPGHAAQADREAVFRPLHEQLKALSRQYFTLRSEWRAGVLPQAGEIAALSRAVAGLEAQYRELLP